MKFYLDIIKKYEIKNNIKKINLNKIIIFSGVSKNKNNKNYIKSIFNSMEYLFQQKPIFSKIKKSISNFKSKIGDIASIYLTLRKKKMWEFYHKLICIVLPKIKEFKGINCKKIDRFGNIHFGIDDISIFPDYYNEFKFGINISIVLKNIFNNFKNFYKIINFPIK
ncbi:MAG: 50S ribosomal protein L5 [Candidatus Carsonella ruddii]